MQHDLSISEPDDPWERQTVRVADQVIRMPDPVVQRACSCGGACAECREDEERILLRTGGGPVPRDVSPVVRHALRSPGEALDSTTRGFMEPRFGAELGAVRIHRGATAAQSARAVGALAYTVGGDIVFGSGQYAPETSAGRRLLAHELTHVLQQRRSQGTAPPGIYRQHDRPSPRVRFPTLELYSALSGGALASRGAPLTGPERADAIAIFGSSINLDAVRIVASRVAAAPTTLGNFIRVPPGYAIPRWVLIHELTHVWQYQTKGTAYISDSAWHQIAGTILSGSRHAAGAVSVVAGKSIHAYTAEQQAVIVTWYFQDPSLRDDAEFARMIGEVRRARPIQASLILEEAAFGPGMGAERWRSPPSPDPGGFTSGPGVPLIRVEF